MHRPEPWWLEGGSVRDADGGIVYDIHPNDDYWHKCDERCRAAHPVEMATAERIVACVNFCRQFDTEFLRTRQLVKIAGKDETTGTLTADKIPGFDGFVAAVLIPVSKETGSEVDVFSDG